MVILRKQVMVQWETAMPPGEHRHAELQDFQRLIEQLTADGQLARSDEEAIMAALVTGSAYASAKCALFRELQERVWRAELHLESRQ
jgi:hypothetical protein